MQLRWLPLLLLLPSTAAAQPTAPQPLPHAAARPDPYDQAAPTIVAGGDGGHLAVWSSDRGAGHTDRISATRLDAAGEPLDPIALDLGPRVLPIDGDDRIAAAWDGDSYTVLWVNGVGAVEARRVHADGTVGPLLTLSPFTAAAEQRWPAIACGDGHCLATWWRFQSGVGHTVRFARLAGDSVVATDLRITAAAGDQHEPAVAWNGSVYLVVWRDIRRPDGGDLYGARVTSAGVLLDPPGFAIAAADGTEDQAAVIWNGSAFHVIWRRGAGELRGTAVASTAVVATPDGQTLAGGPIAHPALAWDGVEHLALWSDGGGVRAMRLGPTGAPLAPAGATWTAAPRATAARAAAGFVVAWSERRSSAVPDTDARSAAVPPGASTPGPPRWIAGVESTEAGPALASDGAGFLAAWIDHRDGWPVIHAARLDVDGRSLDGAGVALSPPAQTADEVTVAGGAGQYLVVWVRRAAGQSTEVIEAARVGADGTVLDAAPLALGPAQPFFHRATPAAIWNGEHYVVVWADPSDRIVGARVSAAGELVDAAPFTVSRSATRATRPAIAAAGSIALVVWDDDLGLDSRVAAARLDDATLLDADDLELATRAAAPLVAGGPRGFLVTWSGQQTRGRRYDATGQPLAEPLAHVALPGGDASTYATFQLVGDGASWLYLRSLPGNTGGPTTYLATRFLLDGTLDETVALGDSTAIGRAAAASTGTGRAAFVFTTHTASPYELHAVDHLWSLTWRSELTLPPPDPPDGGTTPPPPDEPGGCCSAGGPPSPATALLLLLLVPRRRRRVS